MRLRILAGFALLSLATGVALSSCNAASFTPASQVKSLRVLAVQKRPAYAAPDQPADLSLLYWDGRAQAASPQPIQVCFFNCFNPIGDLYYNCFADVLGGGDAGTSAPPLPTCVTVTPGAGDDAGTGT